MKKVAVISAILENPAATQEEFNNVVSSCQSIIRGRMGIPFEGEGIAVISMIVSGTMDEINSLTGKLGGIDNVMVKTAVSKKEVK